MFGRWNLKNNLALSGVTSKARSADEVQDYMKHALRLRYAPLSAKKEI
jgi:hypothetical protein